MAEEARQQNHSHLHYLEALLQAEVEDRERRSVELRLKDAHLPRMKTLGQFDFAQSPHHPTDDGPRLRFRCGDLLGYRCTGPPPDGYPLSHYNRLTFR